MPSIGDITGRIVLNDTAGSPAAIKFGENLEKVSKTIVASMSRATLATETAVRDIAAKLNALKSQTKATDTGKGLLSDLQAVIKKRQEEIVALKSGPVAIEALNKKRYEEAQALKIAAAQVQAGISAESDLGKEIAKNIRTLDRYEEELSQVAKAQAIAVQKAEQQVAVYRKMSEVGSTLTTRVTLPLVALGGAAIKSAMTFESSFAGVRKTVNATEGEFKKLEAQIRALAAGPNAIPIDVNKLNAVAEAAGQLGIAKDDIVAFTRTMADLGETTNLTADEAATATAQFQNIFGAAGKEVDRFGSTLVALGNAGASTEKDIISMGLRIAGAGVQLGLSQGQVLAYASSLASMGIEAEAGGSAISKVMIDIALAVSKGGNELANFASVAGLSADEFTLAFKQDAAGAVASFIEGLGRMKTSGQDVLGTLDAMGITEIRMRDALLRASGAGDLLRNSLKLQAEAWRDNNALTDEAKKRYQTFESQLRLVWNQVKDIAITFGTALLPALLDALKAAQSWIDALKGMAEGFANASPGFKIFVLTVGAMTAAIGPAIFVTGQLLLAWSQIVAFAPGVVTAMSSVALATKGLIVVGALLSINELIKAWGRASDAVAQYNLEAAKVEGNALAFAQQVSQGALNRIVSQGTFDQKIKEADILAGHIVRVTKEVENLNKTIKSGEGQQGVLGGLANQAKGQLGGKEQELKNLWSAYGKLRTALSDVTIAGEKVDDTLGTGTNPFGGLVTSSEEAIDALKSIEDMITALERQRKAEEALFAALDKGPEAYRAQQRANEIDLKIQEARNTLAEQGLSLSAEMEARIRSAVGAIFDLGTATEKLNAVISAANSLYQTSITNIGALAEAVKAVKLESTTQNIVSLSKAFLESDLNISKMEAALSLLNPESDLAKKLTHQLAIETDSLTSAYQSNTAAIKQRTLSIAESSRHSEDLIRRELSAIRERNDAMLKGAGSLSVLERQRDIAAETSRIMADLKPNLGTETIEEFGRRWLRLAKEIRTELETEYKIEIAADLKASLETPSEALQKYLALIDDLSHAVDTSGKVILTATEAEELRTRAISEHISTMLSEWQQFFSFLGDMFGGVFALIDQAIQKLEQAKAFGETVKNLAANSGSSSMTSMAGALGGVATTFAIFAAIYQGVSDHIKKKKLQRYGGETEFEMIKGDIGTTALAAQSNDVIRAIKATIKAFGDALGGVVTDIAEIGIRIRNDGKYIAAYVKGEMIGHFASVDEAIQAALREMVINGGIQLGGISDLVKLGFDQSYKFPDFEDLITFLKSLKEVSDLSFSPAIIDQLSQVRHFDELWKALEKVSHVTDAVVKGFQNLGIAEAQTWQALFDSITGRQRSAAEIRADKEKELAIAKAELEIRKAAIGQRILEARAQIEALKAGNMFIGGGGDRRGSVGGILGVAKAFAVAGEVLIGVSSAVTRTISAESEALIALLEKEIAGLEELLKALGNLDIPDIGKIGGGGKGRGLQDLRDDIRKQIAQLAAESKGPLHAAFYNFEQSIRDFIARAKEAKLPADELAKGIALLTEAFRKGLLDSARDRAGLDSDFTKRLRDTQQFFDELEALGRKNTGIPDWLRRWMEGQAFEKLGGELLTMIGEFGGLVDPILAINMRAAELRQNVIAFAEAAGWSSEQIEAAMAAIEAGAQYQRQQGINSVLDRLFGYLKQAGLFQKEAQEFERQKALTDLALLEAQLRFYGALSDQTQAWIDAARGFILGPGFGNTNSSDDVQKVRVVNSDNPDWDDIVERIKDLVDDWRAAVKQFADSTAALMTDDQLSNLTQAEQLAFAKSQVEDLVAKAQAGDIEALVKLDAARAEYLKELRESEGAGFGFDKGWDWVMDLTAEVLKNAKSAEDAMIAKELEKNIQAWAYVMDKLAEQLETAFYLNTQSLIDAIYNAIGGVPNFAEGGIVMRGPRIVRVAEYIPEAIVPLDRLTSMVPYPKVGDSMIAGGNNRSRQDARSDFYRSIADRDALARLSSVEITSNQTARALVSIKNDISAMRRKQ